MITLPGITIHSKIYESSASLVYRGIREQDNCAVIAKVLKQDYPSPQDLTRYRQEYEITRFLNIEGVVKAYSQQDYQRTLVILLEDFGGESLECWMRQQLDFCPMPLPVFLNMAIAITDTLGEIHTAHVIHKDINPGNIVFNPKTGVVKIIDFGIATRFSRTNPTFKSLHLIEGTPAYLSPEQTGRMNRMLDYRTDFYSLGATFYELLTGQLPFPTTDLLELVHCHIARPPTPPHELNSTIPQPVSNLILKLMAKNAEDRYQSAWGIKADLERCAQQLAETGQINNLSLGLQDVSDQFYIPQKLYGREAEIEALLTAFDKVTGSRESEIRNQEKHSIPHPPPSTTLCSKMMLVSGYAGIGKTALVQELHKPITTKQGHFVSGKFDQFGRNIPYSAIVNALQKLVQQLLSEPDEQVEVWRSRLLTALGSNGQIIIDVIPEVELIIGKQSPIPEVGATEAQNRFNLTFQRFMRAFCAKEHPLVIFLDDLQWIDSATLKLIELILLDEQIQYLFLIGAYRDNKLTPTHPLVLTLESLRNQGAVLQEITLTPLTLEPLTQLVTETLHRNPDTVRSLAQVVLRKTEGNPFFVGEFLKLLHSENLLTFDAQQLSWQWNLAEIEAQDITDNVVELLLHQLQKLPEATQQVLSIAACVGAEFDLETLAFSAERNSEGIVCERSPKAIFQDLLEAIQAGLIQPLSDLDEDLLVQEYKFLHDRVQQAAYALIDESQKQVVHLQIGRNLLEKTSPEQRSDRLFEIIDHLNKGLKLVFEQTELNEIARLNLIAGQKAKGGIAYSTASNYLTTGRQCLEASSWKTNYDLTLELYVETTEVAYLCGEFEQVEYWAVIVLQEAKTVLETVKVYEVKIQTDIAQNQPLKAIDVALQVLHQLGIDFPKTPSQSDIRLELDAITALFNGKEVESLIDLPEMTEPSKLAAMRILSSITIAAQIAAPDLIPLLAAKQVNLSIQYGNAFVSPSAYATLGLVLCGIIGNIDTGYQFGQLALNLLSQPHTCVLKARTLLIVNSFIIHWKKHTRELLQPLLEGYQIGLETGDLESAAYCAYVYCSQSFINGKELVEIERDIVTYGEAIHHIKQKIALTWTQNRRQVVINLMGGLIDSTRLIDKFYNEEIELPQYETENNETAIVSLHFDKLYLCYLFSEYAQAVENAALAETYLIQLTGGAFAGGAGEPLYYLYSSLARLAVYSGSSTQARSEILKRVAVGQEKMKHWAYHAPMNYLHKYHLVEAEKARVLEQFLEAEEFYEQAISGASENEFIQEEALAYELAAKHYLARGREKIAQTYMKEAHYSYRRWGATAKVKDLETRYPQFFSQSSRAASASIPIAAETITDPFHAAFDLAAVMKAAQALSEIIHLDQLIATLMQVVIENTGAEAGALVLLEDDQLTVVAQCSGSRQCNLEKIAVTDCATIPVPVIYSVERTQETLVFDNAVSEPSFLTDPCIQHQQTRSLLSMPILKQNQLVGILYLENKLSTAVFTRDRLQVLKLLMAQAAISLENARLYEQLADYTETLESKVEQRTQSLQQEIAERQQTEAALRQSEANYRNLLQTANSAIIRYDPQGRIQYINDFGVKLLGYEEHEIIGRTLFETIIPEVELSGRDVRPMVHDLLRNPQAYPQGEGENLCRDGQRVWMAWSNQAIFNDQGDVVEILSVGNDTTQRRQAEEALQRSEAKFRNIFENSQVGIFRTRLSDGLILDANQRFADLFGFDSPDEMIGIKRSTDFYVNPSDREQAVELLKHRGEMRSFEKQVRRRDGTLFWGLYSSRLNVADECIEGVIADISDRKQAEAALRQSEANYRNLVKTANSVIIRYDPQGRIRYINDYGVNLLGYEEHEIVGRTLFETLIPEVDLSGRDIRPYIHDLLDNPQSYPQGENENLCRDGRRVWVAWSNQAIFNELGDLVEILSVGHDITQRKQVEEALQRSEAKFRAIFENSQVGIYRTRTSDGLILDANQRFADLFGFDSPQEIIGIEHTIGYWVNPSDRQQAIEVMKRDGEVRSFEAQMRKRDGTVFWGLFSSYLNAGDGYIEGVLADISDRKQAEAALQISEERLRLALTASNQGLYDINIKTEEVVVSPGYPLMLGYDPATFQVTIASWIECLHPDDRESVLAAYHASLTGEVPSYQAEYRHRTQDGQWKWVFAVGNVVAWNEFGEPIRALGVVTDINDRKQAEAALQVSESKLRNLIEAIPDPLFVFSAEGRFLEIMVLDQNLLWHPFEEMIGKTMHQLGREEADEFLGYIQQVLKTRQILTVEYGAFLNGREMWFSARIAPISHDQVIWLVRDITAQKQAEEASILEERNRMAREIHDTLAQSFTGILAQVGAVNQVLTDDVEAAQAHLDLIKELARTGLTEARRSVVALRPQLLEEGSLQSALHRLVAQTRAAAMDTTLHYEIEGTVYALPNEVENNLLRMGQEALTNAIKHANADEIRVQLAYGRDQVCLRVRDNGQGFGVGSIPASEGFGLLGMSERAERIGAQLTIRSQPGQGTEIIVTVNRK